MSGASSKMKVLLTGGAGYIGSHAAVALLTAGHQVVIVDSLINSDAEVIRRVEKISGHRIPFVKGDVRDTELLVGMMNEHGINAVMHFAGLKAVGESVE